MPEPHIVLASQSPRRQELLRFLFDSFEILVSDTDETLPAGITPDAAVESLALRKAQAVQALRPQSLVIGADTVVTIDHTILGKPKDREDAARMLHTLSGRVHQVYTGVAICYRDKKRVFHCVTEVEFSPLSAEEIEWYIHTGEPMDKAGSYGIQGYGARYVKRISGDYFNVMGLPVNSIYREMGDLI